MPAAPAASANIIRATSSRCAALGLESFRIFLMEQTKFSQGSVPGGGLEIDMPLTMGAVWALLCTDVLQGLEYRTRPV